MRKILIAAVLASLFFIFTGATKTSDVFAESITCNLGDQGFNAATGSLQFCTGGFTSKESLRSHFVTFQCLKEKGALACGALIKLQDLPLSDVPDSAIAQSPDGTYYTCRSVTIDSRVELVTIAIRDSNTRQSVCMIQSAGDTSVFNKKIDTSTANIDNTDLLCHNGGGINTAIGCIPINDTNKLISFVLGWALGIAGGIAFLLILVAGFQIMTSRGDPNRLKAGQELLTSAIAGLVLLIFSIFILRVIGFSILNIQSFK